MNLLSKAEPAIFLPPLIGSYAADDCRFLLKEIQPNFQTVTDKEYLIQSGQVHYSEVIHQELAPTSAYTELFKQMTARYQRRLAAEVMSLAKKIVAMRGKKICLVSLARAGTPIGVLLQRVLTHCLGAESHHYSISIIRDRGIDTVALDYLLQQKKYADQSLVFVDGWTAKGVITSELKQSVEAYNSQRGVRIPAELFVISDIGGHADVAATYDDYTMPNALMNSTVSGLISRSVLNQQVGENDFHGCVRYDHLQEVDYSNWFIDEIMAQVHVDHVSPPLSCAKEARQAVMSHFLAEIQQTFRVSDRNRIKPGISEATRVMLRRVPDILLLRDPESEDVAHLKRLAEEKKVAIVVQKNMPVGACALIKDVMKVAV